MIETKNVAGRTIFLIDDDAKPQRWHLFPRREHQRFAAYGSAPFARPYAETDFPLVPESEWSDRIKEWDAKQMFPCYFCTWKPKNQGNTNYCWGNAPVQGVQVIRAIQGLEHVELSPASVCAKINNFRNQGGYGLDAVEYLSETGACPSSMWPDNGIDPDYDTAESRAIRKLYMAPEFVDLPTEMRYVASANFAGFPVPIGLDWWGHEVLAVGVDEYAPRQFGLLIWNSWGDDWGGKINGIGGFSVLSRGKSEPSDCQAMRTATPSR